MFSRKNNDTDDAVYMFLFSFLFCVICTHFNDHHI